MALMTNIVDDSANIALKADKVSGAVNGHLAGLNGSGNLTDSGYSVSTILASVASPLTLTSTSAAQIPLTLVGSASQSGNLLNIKDSSGTTIASVSSTGDLATTGDINARGTSIFLGRDKQSNVYSGLWFDSAAAAPDLNNYSLLSAGTTILNAPTGQNINLRIANATKVTVTTTGADVTGVLSADSLQVGSMTGAVVGNANTITVARDGGISDIDGNGVWFNQGANRMMITGRLGIDMQDIFSRPLVSLSSDAATFPGSINAPQWYGSTHDAIYDSAGSWIFYTDDAERIRINSSGVTLSGNLNFGGHEAIEVQDITLVSGLTPDSTGIATYSQSIDLAGANGNGNINNAGTVTADALVGEGSGITNISPTSEADMGTASVSLPAAMGDITALTLSIPSAGTWEVYGRIRYFCSGGNVIIQLYDDTNAAAIAGTDVLLCASATIHGTGTPTWIISTAGAVTIHLRAMDTSGGGSTILSDSFGWSVIGVKKLPV